MDMSIVFAKLIGLYLLITAALYLFRRNQMKDMITEFTTSKSLLALSGEFYLVFGLVVAIYHSIWELSWVGLVTLMGYLLIVRGILRIGFPVQVKKLVMKMTSTSYMIVLIVMLVIGAYLTYMGFSR